MARMRSAFRIDLLHGVYKRELCVLTEGSKKSFDFRSNARSQSQCPRLDSLSIRAIRVPRSSRQHRRQLRRALDAPGFWGREEREFGANAIEVCKGHSSSTPQP